MSDIARDMYGNYTSACYFFKGICKNNFPTKFGACKIQSISKYASL